MARLTSHVHVPDGHGGYAVYGPDDEVPEDHAMLIGAHAWEGGVHPYLDEDGDGQRDRVAGEEPPRSGKGSGRDAWVAFAGEKGVDAGDMSRDEIVQALIDAGHVEA